MCDCQVCNTSIIMNLFMGPLNGCITAIRQMQSAALTFWRSWNACGLDIEGQATEAAAICSARFLSSSRLINKELPPDKLFTINTGFARRRPTDTPLQDHLG